MQEDVSSGRTCFGVSRKSQPSRADEGRLSAGRKKAKRAMVGPPEICNSEASQQGHQKETLISLPQEERERVSQVGENGAFDTSKKWDGKKLKWLKRRGQRKEAAMRHHTWKKARAPQPAKKAPAAPAAEQNSFRVHESGKKVTASSRSQHYQSGANLRQKEKIMPKPKREGSTKQGILRSKKGRQSYHLERKGR